jgi:hypothetical protein
MSESGTFRTWPSSSAMSLHWGKADIAIARAAFGFDLGQVDVSGSLD